MGICHAVGGVGYGLGLSGLDGVGKHILSEVRVCYKGRDGGTPHKLGQGTGLLPGTSTCTPGVIGYRGRT